jgi:ferritin
MTNVRQTTENLIELADEDMIDKDTLIINLLSWMSEDDVVEFVGYNDYFYITEEKYYSNPRLITEKMIDLLAEEMVDKDTLIIDLLNWLSEDDVEEFAVANEYL